MRLLANYTQCTVIGIDYTLSPEARFPGNRGNCGCLLPLPPAGGDYQINMSRIGFAGDSAGAIAGAFASALWLRDKQIDCGKVAAVLLWYGLYGLRDSVTCSSVGRCLGWLNATGFADV